MGQLQHIDFHAGSSLNSNGEIVWAGNTYQDFPYRQKFCISKRPNTKTNLNCRKFELVTNNILTVNQTTTGNDLTGATVTRIRTLVKFIDAVNFAGNKPGTPETQTVTQEIYTPIDIVKITKKQGMSLF